MISLNFMQRMGVAALAASSMVFAACATAAETNGAKGLVKEKPASGFFVETPQGFMVPYTAVIEGTDIKIEMVPVPGGTVTIGANQAEIDANKTDNIDPTSEGPQFQVEIEPFWMGKYEITWDQFDPFLAVYEVLNEKRPEPVPADRQADAISYPTPIYPQEAIPIINAMGRKDGFPAASMHQFCAKQYTKWISKIDGSVYRLPTGTEWEHACRAGTKTMYSFGDDKAQLKDYAWYFDNSEWEDGERGHPATGSGYRKVGQKRPNPWGLYDMHGNVSEWVLDQFDPNHYKQFAGKTVKSGDVVNWPKEHFPREVRGGNWDSDGEGCRSASRLGTVREWTESDPQIPRSVWFMTEFWAGFRVIRPLNTPSQDEKTKFWEPDIDHIREVLKDTKQRRALPQKP